MTKSVNAALLACVNIVILERQRFAFLSMLTSLAYVLISVIYLLIFMRILYSFTGVEFALFLRILYGFIAVNKQSVIMMHRLDLRGAFKKFCNSTIKKNGNVTNYTLFFSIIPTEFNALVTIFLADC